MSNRNRFRALLMATAAGAGLALSAGSAHALEYTVGEVKVFFDTTLSTGASVRTGERITQFLPEGNGGPVDPRLIGLTLPGIVTNPGTNPIFAALPAPLQALLTAQDALVPGSLGAVTLGAPNCGADSVPVPVPPACQPFNFDGSINTDDGRLNWERGDITSFNAKASHDLLVQWRNYTLFARAVGFYDFVLDDENSPNRSRLTEKGRQIVGRNYQLLDLYLSADYNLGELPLNLRIGKQVTSWGESTFFLNGINTINPIDVNAFRRPGAEIKEGLLPVNSVYASLGLPANFALEAFYQLDFERTLIDPSGTPFSGADIVQQGSGIGGNEFFSFLSGSPFQAYGRRNCNNTVGNITTVLQALGRLPANNAGANLLNCALSTQIPYQNSVTIGQLESERLALLRSGIAATPASLGILTNEGRKEAGDDGQWGVALRYLAEELGNTEFGFYFTNTHSKLPFLFLRARRGEVGISVTSNSTGSTRALAPTGCIFPIADPRLAAMAASPVSDPYGLLNAARTGGLGATILGGFVANCNTGAPAGGVALLQSVFIDADPGPGVTPQPLLVNGAETYTLNLNSGVGIEYPEDIETWGISFNTTIGGWGVQGELSFRPDAPFQADSDALTIASSGPSCVGLFGFGNAAQVLEQSSTAPNQSGIDYRCSPAVYNSAAGLSNPANFTDISGVLRNEMWTASLGTTATFTPSNPIIEFMGADLGVLVTEINMIYVPGVEDTYLDQVTARSALGLRAVQGLGAAANPAFAQYQNIGCQGTDLPLGGILNLDYKPSTLCRPTNFSFGYTLLMRSEYNNAFNSGWVMAPQITFSHDVDGYTPAPYSSFVEDRMALGLSIQGTLDQSLRAQVGYTAFFGGGIYNKARDQDFASFTVSYAF